MKKVIVRLGNGLGNQLFTYAAAYAFAKKNGAKLYVDDESGFYKRYKFELHNFNISSPIIEKEKKFLGIKGRIKRRILIKINNYYKKKTFLIEKKNHNKHAYYDPEQLNINFNNYLYFEGYFQSEKYFKSEEKNIMKEFSFMEKIVNQKNLFIDMINKSNSVSIHLRQNKFLVDEEHKNVNKLNFDNTKKGIEIIKRGIDYFKMHLEKPTFFLWSDNFYGLREILSDEKIVFVDVNLNKDPAYDLYLMSLCKHFILSPSTMHYWGAYLSSCSNKICLPPNIILDNSGYYGFSNNKDIRPDWWRVL